MAFLFDFSGKLRAMDASQFTKYVSSLRAHLQQKDNNLSALARRFWSQIEDGRYDFRMRDSLLQELSTVTLQEVSTMFEYCFCNTANARCLVACAVKHTDASATNEVGVPLEGLGHVVADVESLRFQLPLFQA